MAKKDDYLVLLENYKSEQDLQNFLELNTEFIPREFIQNHGIHNRLVFRKLKIAENYTTDFFYLSKSSGDWNCVLIELEKPNSKFFKSGTNELHNDFTSGLNQIDKWRAWFANGDNKQYFTNQALSFIRQPLFKNPCNFKYVLVTGRRKEFENNELRTSIIQAKERDDFKILSFDSLLESIDINYGLYLCVKKNEYFEIHSTDYLSENVFIWTAPEHIRLTNKLKTNLVTTMEQFIENVEKGNDAADKLFLSDKKRYLESWEKYLTID
jgi:hypothetical protein